MLVGHYYIGGDTLAAIQNDETMSQTASRLGVRPIMVSNWKRQMLEDPPVSLTRAISPENK